MDRRHIRFFVSFLTVVSITIFYFTNQEDQKYIAEQSQAEAEVVKLGKREPASLKQAQPDKVEKPFIAPLRSSMISAQKRITNRQVKLSREKPVPHFENEATEAIQIDGKKYQWARDVWAVSKKDYVASMGAIAGEHMNQYLIKSDEPVGRPVVNVVGKKRIGIVTGNLNVRWKNRSDEIIFSRAPASVSEAVDEINFVIYKVEDPKNVFDVAKSLKDHPDIQSIKAEVLEVQRKTF